MKKNWIQSAPLSELKEWLEKNEDVSYLGHGTAARHELLVEKVRAEINEREE
jgi:hypothetical protein|tara:strand:+ start:935 stop:1090 length:156 start_codon:yes stop_codon:yes gene_type:complete